MTTLEKIREEIEFEVDHRTNMLCAEDVFEIIDKYAEQEPLTEEDYKELHDRFGDYVEFVVRDMVSGTGERWRKAVNK